MTEPARCEHGETEAHGPWSCYDPYGKPVQVHSRCCEDAKPSCPGPPAPETSAEPDPLLPRARAAMLRGAERALRYRRLLNNLGAHVTGHFQGTYQSGTCRECKQRWPCPDLRRAIADIDAVVDEMLDARGLPSLAEQEHSAEMQREIDRQTADRADLIPMQGDTEFAPIRPVAIHERGGCGNTWRLITSGRNTGMALCNTHDTEPPFWPHEVK